VLPVPALKRVDSAKFVRVRFKNAPGTLRAAEVVGAGSVRASLVKMPLDAGRIIAGIKKQSGECWPRLR